MLPCGIKLNKIINFNLSCKLKMEIERRKHPRFCVRDNAFAVFQPEPVKLVPIVDIGLGGLGIGVNGANNNAEWLKGTSNLEILIDDCSFYLDGLDFQLLPKFRSLPRNAVSPFQHIYGLKFVNLMPSQKSRLKTFIRRYTIGGMTPKVIRKINRHFHQFFNQKEHATACETSAFQVLPNNQ